MVFFSLLKSVNNNFQLIQDRRANIMQQADIHSCIMSMTNIWFFLLPSHLLWFHYLKMRYQV